MNRENICAVRASRRTATPSRIPRHYQQKELCVVWLPEKNSYLQGVTAHALYTIAESDRATVFEGDDATRIAEQVIRCHGLKPVLRAHYGQAQ